MKNADDLTRREFVGASAAITLSGAALSESVAEAAPATPAPESLPYSLTINGQRHDINLDPRVSLLDLLRERLEITGTKKGCDHGQCGACTVISNGKRILSCLTLAITQDGHQITTIEGLASAGKLHPLQTAFIERDGFQCGFCTSGQICSAVAMLDEWRAGMPSAVAPTVAHAALTDPEIRERMAGNICRCGAYPNIVAAIRDVHASQQNRSAL